MGPILSKARGAKFYFTFKSRPKLPFTGAMVMGVVVVVLLHSDLQDLLKRTPLISFTYGCASGVNNGIITTCRTAAVVLFVK